MRYEHDNHKKVLYVTRKIDLGQISGINDEWYMWVTMLNTILHVETKKLGHMLHVWVGRDVRYEIVRLICLVVEKLLLVAKATNINFSSRAGGGCKGLTWPLTSRDPLMSHDPPYATPSLYATRPLTPHGPLTLRVTPPIYATRSPYVVNPYYTPNESLWSYTPEYKWISAR